MKKLFLYPFWLRFWHWLNAALFILLILTGISIHYSASNDLLMPFEYAIVTHNVAGIILSFLFLIFTIMNIKSGNYKYYIPLMHGIYERLVKQGRYYVYGVFNGEPHPYHISEKDKFNPLQQISYFGIIFFMMPTIIISGWLLLFPELAPGEIMGMGGVWPMAVLHSVVGYLLSIFMFGHIYLATHGDTIGANFKSMIDGYHHVHEDEHAGNGNGTPINYELLSDEVAYGNEIVGTNHIPAKEEVIPDIESESLSEDESTDDRSEKKQ
ncbi:MAG: cytochrome b/b6 domain-containing protein [Desulfobulbaceae bacterium]|nr:cytochrome b/b6 domain-containing protein [Candidatus Kapabacteria bacterium]MBS4000207.1 cytochrome b/b6 domain-containing protein [Desulfobulbaceae bacterium]